MWSLWVCCNCQVHRLVDVYHKRGIPILVGFRKTCPINTLKAGEESICISWQCFTGFTANIQPQPLSMTELKLPESNYNPRLTNLRTFVDPSQKKWWTPRSSPPVPTTYALLHRHNSLWAWYYVWAWHDHCYVNPKLLLALVLGIFMSLTPLYHMLEYLCVAMYNPDSIEMDCKFGCICRISHPFLAVLT